MSTGTARELQQLFRIEPLETSRARTKRRRELAEAVRSELEACIEDIRRRQRETPAWQHGYESAITAIELRIAKVNP